MLETMQEDVWKSNSNSEYITETDYEYVDEVENVEPNEVVYPPKIVHDEIMNRFNMKSWQIRNYDTGQIVITVPEWMIIVRFIKKTKLL